VPCKTLDVLPPRKLAMPPDAHAASEPSTPPLTCCSAQCGIVTVGADGCRMPSRRLTADRCKQRS